MNCPKCRRAIMVLEQGLQYCLRCGYETPESQRHNPLTPSVVDRLLEHEPEEEERPQPRKERPMSEPAPQMMNLSADEIAASCRHRITSIDRAIAQLQDKAAALRVERARLQKVVTLLDPSAPTTTGQPGSVNCEICGAMVKAGPVAIAVHKSKTHGIAGTSKPK